MKTETLPQSSLRRRLLNAPLGLFAALLLLCPIPKAQAANETWISTSGTNWSTSGNWGPTATLTSGADTAYFGADPGSGTTLNNDISSLTLVGLVFNSNAASYTFNGNSLTLGTGANQDVITINNASTQTFNLPIALSAGDKQVRFNVSGTTIFNGSINYGSGRLFTTGSTSGTVVLNGANTGNGTSNNPFSTGMQTTFRTSVAGSVVVLGNKNALGNAGAQIGVQVNADSTFMANTDLSGANAVINGFVIGGANTLTIGGTNNFQIGGNIWNAGANRAIAVTNTGSTILSGTIFLSNDTTARTLTITPSAGTVTTISGVIASGTGATPPASSLTMNGTGTVVISGSNTYTGATTLSSGALSIGNANALGTGSLSITTGTLDNSSAGALSIANAISLNGNLVFVGSQNLTATGTTSVLGTRRDVTVNANTLTFGGQVAFGTAGIAKLGSGKLVLNSADTGAGETTAIAGVPSLTRTVYGKAGTIEIGNANALGTGALNLDGNGLVFQSNTSLTGASAVANLVVMTNNAVIGGSSNLELSGTFINGGNLTLTASNSAATTLSGPVFISGSAGASQTLTVNVDGAAGNTTISGAIADFALSGSAGNLTKSGAGTLTLSGNSSYTGVTTVSAGALKIGNANALGANGTTASTTVSSGATLDLNGQTIAETLNISGTGVNGNGALINSGATATVSVDIPSSTSFTVGGTGDINLQRIGSNNSGIFTLTKVGTNTVTTSGTSHNNLMAAIVSNGTLVLANASGGLAIDRGLTVNGGVARLSGANTNLISDTQEVIVTSGTFDLNGKNETIGRLTIGDGTNNGFLNGSGSTLTVTGSYQTFGAGGTTLTGSNIEAKSGTINANIAGSAGLNKTTNGVVTLNGGGAYTGATTINAGTLAVGQFGGITGSPTISISAGATFDTTAKSTAGFNLLSSQTLTNNGTINGNIVVGGSLNGSGTNNGTTTISNGTISPGTGLTSAATITLNNNVAMTSGTFAVNIDGATSDKLSITGNLDLSGGSDVLTLSILNAATQSSYTIATYTGTLTGTFADVSSITSQGYTIDYGTGANSSITLVAVPEPSTWVIMVAGLGMLVFIQKIRRPVNRSKRSANLHDKLVQPLGGL